MVKGLPNNPKECILCGQLYQPKNNRQKVCKSCQPEYDRQWNKAYNKRTLKRRREVERLRYEKKGLSYICWRSVRDRVRGGKNDIPFNIEPSDVIVPEFCPVLGLKLERGDRKFKASSPSVDRIIPELGYVKGNIQVLSYKANTMKSNASKEELLKFADWIYKTYA